MIIIPVDYNAATKTGSLWLHFDYIQQALAAAQFHVGDWVWVSDNEVLVGAQLKNDPVYGLVAQPHWQSIVHLDDYIEVDWPSFQSKLVEVLQRTSHEPAAETEVFQLLTVFDRLALPELKQAVSPGFIAFRAASALRAMGEPNLAWTWMERAILERPHDPDYRFVYLDHLRQLDPARAEAEARSRGSNRLTHAVVLAACINVLAAMTDRLSESEFATAVPPILDWIDRFDAAPGRDRVRPAVLALVQFNQGSLLLRLGRHEEAMAAFDRAHATDPSEPTITQARSLQSFNQAARDLATQYRLKSASKAA